MLFPAQCNSNLSGSGNAPWMKPIKRKPVWVFPCGCAAVTVEKCSCGLKRWARSFVEQSVRPGESYFYWFTLIIIMCCCCGGTQVALRLTPGCESKRRIYTCRKATNNHPSEFAKSLFGVTGMLEPIPPTLTCTHI